MADKFRKEAESVLRAEGLPLTDEVLLSLCRPDLWLTVNLSTGCEAAQCAEV